MTSTKDFDRWMAQAKEIDALQAENIRLRDQAEALATALEEISRRKPIMGSDGEHLRGQVRAFGVCRDVAQAALRAYREATP